MAGDSAPPSAAAAAAAAPACLPAATPTLGRKHEIAQQLFKAASEVGFFYITGEPNRPGSCE